MSNKAAATEAKNKGNAALQAGKFDEAIAFYTEVSEKEARTNTWRRAFRETAVTIAHSRIAGTHTQ